MRKNVKICATTPSSESGFAFSLKMKKCFALEFWRKAIIFGHKNTKKLKKSSKASRKSDLPFVPVIDTAKFWKFWSHVSHWQADLV